MTQQILKLGTATWNPGTLGLTGPGGAPVTLSNKARDALACLADASGEVVARETLAATVWPEVPVDEAALARVVDELRQAIGDGDGQILRRVSDASFQLSGDWAEVPDAPGSPPGASPGAARRRHPGWYVVTAVVVLGVLWVVTRSR